MRTSIFAFLCLASPVLAQNIVVNGGFETPSLSSAWAQRLPGTTFGNWTVDNTGQGIVQVGTFGSPGAAEGSQCLELNFYVSGGVSQALATTPGVTYAISFLMAGQTNAGPDLKQITLDWGSVSMGVYSWNRAVSGSQWVRQTVYAPATSASTLLHFVGVTPANEDGGPYLDDVSVTPCLAITQQPQSQSTCPGSVATFSVTASSTGTPSYRWELEVSPNVWNTLGNDPMPLPCGGNSSHAFAQPPFAATTNISVHGCPGPFRVRAVITNPCGTVRSAPATLTFCVADVDDGSGTGRCDGGVTVEDLLFYLQLFSGGDIRADIDDGSGTGTRDEGVTIDDLLFYLAHFAAGC